MENTIKLTNVKFLPGKLASIIGREFYLGIKGRDDLEARHLWMRANLSDICGDTFSDVSVAQIASRKLQLVRGISVDPEAVVLISRTISAALIRLVKNTILQRLGGLPCNSEDAHENVRIFSNECGTIDVLYEIEKGTLTHVELKINFQKRFRESMGACDFVTRVHPEFDLDGVSDTISRYLDIDESEINTAYTVFYSLLEEMMFGYSVALSSVNSENANRRLRRPICLFEMFTVDECHGSGSSLSAQLKGTPNILYGINQTYLTRKLTPAVTYSMHRYMVHAVKI